MHSSSFFQFHPLKPTGASFSGTLRRPRISFLSDHDRLEIMAFKKDDSGGKMVDENMIVLRERIRKLKDETECISDRLPDNWMRWEKTYVYSGGYHSDVYKAVAVLQRFLMESRPSVALGLVVVLAVGGSAAAVTVLHMVLNLVPGS